MDTIGTYKNSAVASLTGKWGNAAIATLIYIIVMSVPMYAVNEAIYDNLGNVVSLVLLPLSWGYALYFLRTARSETADYGTLFDGFKDYLRIFLTMLLVQIYTVLWMLLLIVPGIIKSYSYSMTSFVLADNPDMKYDAAIEESMRLMKGHKMDLFLLDLSMIGWGILSLLTAGIGLLFLAPYNTTAHAHFYEGLLAEDNAYSDEQAGQNLIEQ